MLKRKQESSENLKQQFIKASDKGQEDDMKTSWKALSETTKYFTG